MMCPKNMNIEDKVKTVFANELGMPYKDIHLHSKLAHDLGVDSLGTVELTMALEEEFNIDLPDEEAEKLSTVGEVVKYIEGRKK